MANKLKIGHLSKTDESKIATVPVTEGQVIYSENSGMQFVDYANNRHTQGHVISGIYNSGVFTDFADSDLDTVLSLIKTNGFINDGQIIRIGNAIYKYRKVGDNNFITRIDHFGIEVPEGEVGFAINVPGFSDGDTVNISLLVSVSNETNGDKLFLVNVVNNEIDFTQCEDMDGAFDSATFDITLAHNGNGLFTISANIESKLKVVSYTVTSDTGLSEHEGFYIVASDL